MSIVRHPSKPDAGQDADLVRSARQGDQAALTELYRRYERQAYNLALRVLGNPWDAADVTQEAFIKAFRNLDSYKGEARFGTWLHRIVVNAAYDCLRQKKAQPMDDETMAELSNPFVPSEVLGAQGLEPAVDGLSEPVKKALRGLNEGFRFAVVLCDLLGFPYSEAAEILGVQEGTIKSRVFRAREFLASALEKEGYHPGETDQCDRTQGEEPKTELLRPKEASATEDAE